MTIAALAIAIADVIGYQGSFKFDPAKPSGTPRKLLDVSKLKALGWAPRTSLKAGLEKAYEDYLGRYA
jgi:GDP-L-fucose synthase